MARNQALGEISSKTVSLNQLQQEVLTV